MTTALRPVPSVGDEPHTVRQEGVPRGLDFGDFLWAMLAFYFWFIFIWLFIVAIGNIFRRDDLSGVAKAGWILLILILPLIGVLIYMASRPRVTVPDERLLGRTGEVPSAYERY
jgi:hypothetical protein